MTGKRVVAVTGATGFLGPHLIAALLREGARVRILARRYPASGLDCEIIRGSLEEGPALDRLTAGANAVIHAAGLIKARDRAAFFRTNVDGSRAVAEAALRNAPNARFVAISSLAARAPELSDYAASKRAGEDAVRAVLGDKPVIVRPPTIYGPGDRETLAIFQTASRTIVPLFGSGRLAIVHVTDAAAAIARLAMGTGNAGCFALADANPAGYTLAELMAEAARAIGRRPRFLRMPDGVLLAAGKLSSGWSRLSGGTPIFTAGKAREMLHPDWTVPPDEALPAEIHRPAITLPEGFAATVAWYRAAGWLSAVKRQARITL
jgi:2-alkyl-3-oxoalkanoate reductase